VIEPSGNVNWKGEVRDVLEDDGGVETVGERDRLFEKTYGAVSRLFSEVFCSSTWYRCTYVISDDVRVGEYPGDCDEPLLAGAPLLGGVCHCESRCEPLCMV
jgi:hypothetical protein